MIKTGLENIARKEENAGCQHFLFFPQCLFLVTKFSPFSILVAVCIVVEQRLIIEDINFKLEMGMG